MPEKTLVLATHNLKKRKEIQAILGETSVRVLTMEDFPDVPDPVEDGRTFSENARKKALFVAERTGHYALADDSGLEVDALDGAPGVYSARYSGVEDKDRRDGANIEKLLRELEGVPAKKRTARFRCVMALASPAGIVGQADGAVEGRILESPRGSSGFGYDPVFYYDPFGRTFAEAAPEEKNQVSHRARALEGIRAVLLDEIE